MADIAKTEATPSKGTGARAGIPHDKISAAIGTLKKQSASKILLMKSF